MDSKNFSAFEIDAIGEILNISLGASAHCSIYHAQCQS